MAGMTTTGTSRIVSARKSLGRIRVAVVAGSIVLFGAAFAAARASHPAQATSSSSGDSGAASTFGDQQDDGGFGFGAGSIGPSSGGSSSFGTRSS
jgi:hypothetical protein